MATKLMRPEAPIAPAKKAGRPREFDREEALHRALETFWRTGYEPTSVAELCSAMQINSPSLYLSFGNKAKLFLEAVEYYEKRYWSEPWDILEAEVDLRSAFAKFFKAAVRIFASPATPFGCIVVLSAAGVSPSSSEVDGRLREMRELTKTKFLARLARAVSHGDLGADTPIDALASALNALLQGMSIQARDGASAAQLHDIASAALALFPPVGDRPRKRKRAIR